MISNKDKINHSVSTFLTMKKKKQKIAMLTAYDYAMARSISETDIDIILVGDSLGMVVLGYENTLQVTMHDMIYHTQAVKRGAGSKFIIADMPFMSYHLSVADAKLNAANLIIKGGANAVKLEGGSPARLEVIKAILDCEIPVCGHIGLTPQSIHKMGGYKVQGKTQSEYDRLYEEALQIERAGAFMLVLEGVPEALGKAVSEAVKIPTISIGAGRYCDGQVLVFHDMLGWSEFLPKFVKQFAEISQDIAKSANAYAQAVKAGKFPTREQVYYPLD